VKAQFEASHVFVVLFLLFAVLIAVFNRKQA